MNHTRGDLPDQVRQWRTYRGLTQTELEQRARLSHNAISRIETGAVSPRLETVERIAGALELDVEELQFRAPAAHPTDDHSEALTVLMERLGELPESRRRAVLQAFHLLLDQLES